MDRLTPDDPTSIGRYKLIARLGRGGMGVVYLGRSPGGRPVAIKVVHEWLASDPGFRQRFAQELSAARRVGGFHTAPLVDAAPDAARPWLVTAYIPGPSLAEVLSEHGGLPETSLRVLAAGLAEAFEAIHATGLVHRDLKPSNVIMASDGPRVIDFGIARALDSTGLTSTSLSIGTPGFMAPEQITRDVEIGPACDVFSMGLVLCHAAGGEPFGSGTAHALLYRVVHEEPDLTQVPENLRGLVGRCLAKDPGARPTPGEILAATGDITQTRAGTWLPVTVRTMILEYEAQSPEGGEPASEGDVPASESRAPDTAETVPAAAAQARPAAHDGVAESDAPAGTTAGPQTRETATASVRATGTLGAANAANPTATAAKQWIVPGYRHTRELGSGASGRVVLALHEASGTPVAIKYLGDDLRADPDFLTEFREEARLLGDLDSPYVVRLWEYVETAAGPAGAAIVMELVDGIALRALLKQAGSTGPEAALVVLKGSLLGLAAAHALGVVHRDYKPENVLVAADGSSKLVDFGIAVKAGDAGGIAGTPPYMAPEQWVGEPASPAADVYAATATFFECLVGSRPYAGVTFAELVVQHTTAPIPDEQAPEAVRPLIRRGLAKQAGERPVGAAEFVAELEAIAGVAYGPDWERRGREKLAGLAALLPLLFPSAGGGVVTNGTTALAETTLGPRPPRRVRIPRKILVGSGTGIALVAVLTALTLAGGTGPGHASGAGTPNAATTLSATASPPLGTSQGTPSPTGASRSASSSSSPNLQLTLQASFLPQVPGDYTCGGPRPSMTANGNITASRAATVTYQWLRSDGSLSTPSSLTLAAGVNTAVAADTWTPGSDRITDTLQVSSPQQASTSATFHLACGPAFPTGPTVPQVIGLGVTDAENRLVAAGFSRMHITVMHVCDTSSVQAIETQTPAAGQQGTPSTQFVLTIPFPNCTALPNEVGQPVSTAQADLQNLGFRVEIQPRCATAGCGLYVVSQSPDPATRPYLRAGNLVVLTTDSSAP